MEMGKGVPGVEEGVWDPGFDGSAKEGAGRSGTGRWESHVCSGFSLFQNQSI